MGIGLQALNGSSVAAMVLLAVLAALAVAPAGGARWTALVTGSPVGLSGVSRRQRLLRAPQVPWKRHCVNLDVSHAHCA